MPGVGDCQLSSVICSRVLQEDVGLDTLLSELKLGDTQVRDADSHLVVSCLNCKQQVLCL